MGLCNSSEQSIRLLKQCPSTPYMEKTKYSVSAKTPHASCHQRGDDLGFLAAIESVHLSLSCHELLSIYQCMPESNARPHI